MWHHKLHKGGALTRELADIGSGASMGIAALSQDLTINGQTVSPTFRYEAKNATTGLWTATVGENLTGAGSGGTVGLDTPLLTDDESVNGDGTRYWQGSTTVQAGTKDFIIETVFYAPSTATSLESIIGTRTASKGIHLRRSTTSAQIQWYVAGDGGARNVVHTGMANGAWYHGMFVCDNDGSNIAYLNGVASSATAGAIGNVLDDAAPVLCGLTSNGNMRVAYIAGWYRETWLSTHLIGSVVEERFARLNGTWSSALSKGPDQSLLRNSVATLEKQGQSGGQKLFTVGARWPRIEKRPDKYGRYAVGYNSEGQHTNLLTYSEAFDNAFWSKSRLGTVVVDNEAAPDGSQTADTVPEDNTTGGHTLSGVVSFSAGTYTFGVWAKAINRSWLRLAFVSTVDGTSDCYFDVASGVLGTTSGLDRYGMRYYGDGWYYCWITDTRATTETQRAYLYLADDDASFNYTGLSLDAFHLWGAQATATAYPVSYIKTEGATVTRLADRAKYTGAFPSKGSIAVDLLEHDGTSGTHSWGSLSAAGSSNNAVQFYASNVSATLYVTKSAATQALIQAANREANVWHEFRAQFDTNNVRILKDGALIGPPDTSADMPASLDTLEVAGLAAGTFPPSSLVRLRLLSKPTDKNVTDFGAIMAKSSAYVSTPAAVAQSTSYANVGGTFTEVNSSDFTVSAAGVFTYTGTDTKRFACFAACSATVSSGTPEVSTAFEKNGTEVASSVSKRDVSGSGIGAWGVTADIELANGDTLNLATKVDSGTPNLTLEACSVVIVEAGN